MVLLLALLAQLALGGELRSADGRFIVEHAPAQERLARTLLDAAVASPPFPGLPGTADTARPIRILLAPDEATFTALTGRAAPDWSAGVAYPREGVTVLPAYASDRAPPQALARTLRHELAHIALHRWLEGSDIPRWFDEGYARYAAGEWDAEAAWQIRLAFALQKAPPLDSLTLGFPRAAADARLAYLLSTTAVQYLVDASGEDGLARFLARWRALGDIEAASREVYGVSLGQLEEDWRSWVQRRYGWAAFLAQATVFWFFATLLLLAVRWRRRRRDAAKLEAMKQTEPPDRPAYWAGESIEEPTWDVRWE